MSYVGRPGHSTRWTCAACKGEFYIATAKLAYRSAPQCKLCGSYQVDQKTTKAVDHRLNGEWAARQVTERIKRVYG